MSTRTSLLLTISRSAAALVLVAAGSAGASDAPSEAGLDAATAQREADEAVLAFFATPSGEGIASDAAASVASLQDLISLRDLEPYEAPEASEPTLLREPVPTSKQALKARYSKLKLIRYNKKLNFGEGEQLLKLRAPGARKSIMSLEIKF